MHSQNSQTFNLETLELTSYTISLIRTLSEFSRRGTRAFKFWICATTQLPTENFIIAQRPTLGNVRRNLALDGNKFIVAAAGQRPSFENSPAH